MTWTHADHNDVEGSAWLAALHAALADRGEDRCPWCGRVLVKERKS